MGKIKQGILGGFSGKVGSVIGSSWKGIAVMKSRPLSVANPKTAGQEEQRGKFKGCTLTASIVLSSIVKPLNDRFNGGISGYNAFVKRNVANFNEDMSLAEAEISISRGKMNAPFVSTCTASGQTINIVIDTDISDAFGKPTDDVFVAVFSKNKPHINSQGFAKCAKRMDGNIEVTCDIAIIQLVQNEEFVVAVSFLREDGTVVSNNANYALIV